MILYVVAATDPTDVALVELFQEVTWNRRLYEPASAALTMVAAQVGSIPLEKGRLLYVADGSRAYMIEQVHRGYQTSEDGTEVETVVAQGREVGGMFVERIIIPPTGSSHDVQTDVEAETAMKHYVNLHAGPGAVSVPRRLPGLAIAADLSRGSLVTYEARFQTLAEVLNDIGLLTEVGWEVTYDIGTGDFSFEVIVGADRTGEVFLDPEFETAASMEWLTSDLGKKNWGLGAGQGEGTARETVEVYLGVSEPSGFDRREAFIDANDVGAGEGLDARTRAKLLETMIEDALEVTVNPGGPFQFEVDFDLGDRVTVRHRGWGVQADARIIGVSKTAKSSDGGPPTTTIEVGRPFPTVAAKARKGAGGSTRR